MSERIKTRTEGEGCRPSGKPGEGVVAASSSTTGMGNEIISRRPSRVLFLKSFRKMAGFLLYFSCPYPFFVASGRTDGLKKSSVQCRQAMSSPLKDCPLYYAIFANTDVLFPLMTAEE